MKVLHLETGRHLYGGAKQVYYLLKGLSKRDVTNILVCPEGSEIGRISSQYVDKLYEVPMRGDLDILFILRFYRILKKERPQIVHLHSRRGADLLGGIGARLYGKSMVLLTRRVDNPEHPFLVKLKYRLYDRIITISEGIRRVLLEEGVSEEKVRTVRSAIPSESTEKCNWKWFLREFNLSEGIFPVGMVAQFIERKGHRFVIEVAEDVIRIHPEVRFLLFGKGDLEEPLRKEVQKRSLQRWVLFCGFREDLQRIYPCLKLLVHPATMEGLGVSLMEASSAGVPIVAFRVGGIPEVVQDGRNGILLETGDLQGLREALLRLIEDRALREKMSREAKEIARDRFSLDAMIDGNLKIYKELVGKS